MGHVSGLVHQFEVFAILKYMGCHSPQVANVVTCSIVRTTVGSTIEAIHETCRTYECPEFSRKFTTYLQLSYANHKSENLTDNQQLYATYTHRIVIYLR